MSVPFPYCISLTVILASSMLAFAPHAQAQDAGWRIASSLSCAWRACATFTPSDGSPVQEQSWISPVVLDRPGLLQFPGGYTRLERPSTHQVLRVGPGAVVYQGRSHFQALQAIFMEYEHPADALAPLEILLPTLILGTEGTRFRVDPTDASHVALEVEEGRVLLQWIDAPLAPGLKVEKGEILTASSLAPREYEVEKVVEGAPRSVRSPGRNTMSHRGLTQQRAKLEARFDQELRTGQALLTDDELTLLASDVVPSWTAEKRFAAGQSLANVRPENEIAGRVLFQLWLQARLTAASGDDSLTLQRLIQDAYSQTPWPAAVGGVLVLEAKRKMLESSDEVPEVTGP